MTGAGADAQTPPPTTDRWQPARHKEDDWLDQIPGKHRLFFDTTTPDQLADALMFAGNYFNGNRAGYGLENSDVAVVICMRHRSAPFGFNDAIWGKNGATLAARAVWVDPKTQQAPAVNVHTAEMVRLAGRGVQFALCNLSTRAISGLIGVSEARQRYEDAVYLYLIGDFDTAATSFYILVQSRALGNVDLTRDSEWYLAECLFEMENYRTADEAYKDITANMVGASRLVPAGIVAVNRSQERGYSIA